MHVSKTAEPSFGGGDVFGHYSLNPMSNTARQQLRLRCEDNDKMESCHLILFPAARPLLPFTCLDCLQHSSSPALDFQRLN
jgi:hypothetical protein